MFAKFLFTKKNFHRRLLIKIVLCEWNFTKCEMITSLWYPGGHLNVKMLSYKSRDHLLFNRGIPIPGEDSLYIETGYRSISGWTLVTGAFHSPNRPHVKTLLHLDLVILMQSQMFPHHKHYLRDHPWYGLSQWEMSLHCNIISHWLKPYPEWSLNLIQAYWWV